MEFVAKRSYTAPTRHHRSIDGIDRVLVGLYVFIYEAPKWPSGKRVGQGTLQVYRALCVIIINRDVILW